MHESIISVVKLTEVHSIQQFSLHGFCLLPRKLLKKSKKWLSTGAPKFLLTLTQLLHLYL